MSGNSGLLLQSLIAEIKKGIALIEHLSNDTYSRRPGESGSVGTHFRHNLDFCNNFLAGIKSGNVDYGNRERDVRVESDREHAIEKFGEMAIVLAGIRAEDLLRQLLVRSEIDEEVWLPTSVARELEFLHSHTVHHYALIAAKLSAMDIEVPLEFGVAPSTLKYWASREKQSAKA